MLGLLLAISGVAALYAGITVAQGNFHTVIEGELYRSATLSGTQLEAALTGLKVRTIVNLRGASPDQDWYREEARLASAHDVILINLPWSARRELSDAEVAEFMARLADAPRPILIHCRSGADRTGLAAALYLAAIKRADEETAESQLSLWFGHIALPVTPFYAMDETFERLEPSLGYLDS
ncbi:tyrosine-protein phosphatase [Ancylobacter radicis]|uniref:Tyrosine-protein phosphatase n=1 Tax=Ancylobacter radicis TaxID=2836179 RepID=A0ABS5R5J3_9HYPH|nr:tyrosine-protein phosphatase [Ancylobacter radicis]